MSIFRYFMVTSIGLLGACTDSSVQADRFDMLESPPMMAPAPMVSKSSGRQANEFAEDGGQVEQPAYMAYRYNYDFALPVGAVPSSADQHAQICMDAGPKLCQIISRSTQEYNPDNVSASLYLRAEPEWLVGYTKTIADTIVGADGKMTSSSVSAEDLTRQILDVDARLSAQITLRERLSALLETRDAKLPDLLALERELARVQGEIESATSSLKALRQRVGMSIVNINYQTRSRAVSNSAVAPIGRALKQFVATVSEGLASVIYFLAMMLPWFLLVILPGIFGLVWLKRRLSKKTSKT
jgi:hypothetical protein